MSSIEDLDFDDDDIVQDVTEHTVYYINSTPQLYKKLKPFIKFPMTLSVMCKQWAVAHSNEFGDLFQTELDMVDWQEVSKRV